MARHIAVLLLVVVACAALSAAHPPHLEPEHELARPDDAKPEDAPPAGPHDRRIRSPMSWFNKAKNKVKKVVKNVAHKFDGKKFLSCVKRAPGVSQAVKNTVAGCLGTAATGNMGAIASCAAKKAAVPAARAASQIAMCMG